MKYLIRTATLLALTLNTAAAVAHEQSYIFTLDGKTEAPANNSLGTGLGTVTFDLDLVTMSIDLTFAGLSSGNTAAHIHCCTTVAQTGTAGVATQTPTFPGFPTGVTSGTYNQTFDMTQAGSYRAGFITANGGTVSSALNALLAGIDSGQAYFNIHTSNFAAGEIRGFLQPAPVPVPAAIWLFGSGLGLLSIGRRQNQRA